MAAIIPPLAMIRLNTTANNISVIIEIGCCSFDAPTIFFSCENIRDKSSKNYCFGAKNNFCKKLQ